MQPLPPNIDDLVRRLVREEPEHAIVLLDPACQIVGWLGAAEAIFGFSEAKAVGRPIADLYTPEDVAKGMPQFEIAVATRDGRAEDDRWMMRKDGLRFWATGVTVPLRGDDGELLGYGKLLANRTDLKCQLESLEKRVQSLQDANERKNVFIATLAHELRNPLASIANSLAILELEGKAPDDCNFARSTIRRQLDHMRRMIDDLLDVAKTNAGKIPLNRREMPLNGIITAAIETCRASIDRRTHTFTLVMPDKPIVINADGERLRQVFVNLIENACKYTQYGGNIWVKVSVEGDQAVVKVEDSGIGISPDMLPLIFDLFTQAEFGPQEGLGIGLSIVKDVIAQHDGSVQVRSDGIGKGSEFTVRLPLAGIDSQRPDRPGA